MRLASFVLMGLIRQNTMYEKILNPAQRKISQIWTPINPIKLQWQIPFLLF